MNKPEQFAPIPHDELIAAQAEIATRVQDSDGGYRIIMPVPANAPALTRGVVLSSAPKGFRVADRWHYRDAEGRHLCTIVRYDLVLDGGIKKEFRPFTLWQNPHGQYQWRMKSLPAPRPLYGLDKLSVRPGDPVLIVEGEKACDAATQRFLDNVCVTSPGGADGALKADWTPLKGRAVTIWPDHDEAGERYGAQAAACLHKIGAASVNIISASEKFPPKWDLADKLPDGVTDADLAAMISGAAPIETNKSKPKAQSADMNFVSWGEFEMTGKGLYQTITKGRGEKATEEQIWVCAAFEILGATRDPQGRGWGKWLRWRDADRRVHMQHISDAALQADPSALCALLAGDGLSINRNAQRALSSYLSGARSDGRVTIVPRTGWHEIGDGSVFVLPGSTAGPVGSETVILDAAAHGPYDTKGTLNDWQSGVSRLAADHALAVLAISTALAGPLLHLAGQEGGGVNIFGPSSRGKTTLIQCAASVWGRGATPGYVRAWRATANGLEGAASAATDTVLVLDELGIVEARDAAAAIYGLSNGAGKQRAARDGSLRDPKSWRVLTLSTGEIPIDTKLAEDRNRRARAGQLVRMLDVPCDRGFGFGAFDNAGPDGDAAMLAKAFKQAAVTAYGTAGPEFVRKIVEAGTDEIADSVRAGVAEVIAKTVPQGGDGQVDRAAQRFGLIAAAGELAISLGIAPWQAGSPSSAAAWALDQWIAGRGGSEPMEARQAIETVRLVIEQHGETRFDAIDDMEAKPAPNRLGWRRGRGEQTEWLIPPETWKREICVGLDPVFVARTLADAGMLRRQSGGKLQSVANIQNISRRVYIITSAILAGGDHVQ